jgi:hypothetical protein
MRSGKWWPSSRRERINVRARRRLRDAPETPCPHCGRVTKTVDGVCADCWGVKDDARARRWRPKPRTEPLLGIDWDDPLLALLTFGGGTLAVLGLAYVIATWIST